MSTDAEKFDGSAVALVTIGYGLIAMVNLTGGLVDAGWYAKTYEHGAALLFTGAVVLGVLGLAALLCRRSFDATIFLAHAVGFWTFQMAANAAPATAATLTVSLPSGEPLSYEGWNFASFLIIYVPVLLLSRNAGRLRQLFLLGTVLVYAASAVGCWFAVPVLQTFVGYTSMIVAILATAIIWFELRDARDVSAKPCWGRPTR